MLRARINHQQYEFEDGLTILQALRQIGDEVPTLCHDNRLKPAGDCRMCLVEIAGWTRPATACNTQLTDGMSIETYTPELEDTRRGLLAMLAERYPAEAVSQFPDKPFHQLLRKYAVAAAGETEAGETEAGETGASVWPVFVDASHPYLRADMTRCIDCYRCVRICREVQGQFVWQVVNRGAETRIWPDSPTSLRESSCVSCGACVDTCPTGALEDWSVFNLGTATNWTKTTCPYCGTGCEMDVGTRAGRIVTIKPAHDAPVNKGHLCVKGRYAYEFVYAADRVTSPLIRENGEWRKVSWEDALGFAAEKLRRIVAAYGPDSVGVLGSARATNEENYLTQKFARAVLGTNNVDCCARVSRADGGGDENDAGHRRGDQFL